MTKWIRQSGAEIELNDEKATVEHAVAQGWKRADDKPKRTRRTKEQMAEDK